MRKKLMELVVRQQMKEGREDFEVGDSVDVHVKIREGDKERIQVFSGAVISKKGAGSDRTFTVRRMVSGEGVERMFPLHSPALEKIEVKRKGRVRRAKLYYLRRRVGKATRVAERREGEEGPLPIEQAVKPRQAAPKPAPQAPEAQAGAENAKQAEKKDSSA